MSKRGSGINTSTYSIKLVEESYRKQLERSIVPRSKDGVERAGKNSPLAFFKVGKCEDGGIVNAPLGSKTLNECSRVICDFTKNMDYAVTLKSKYGSVREDYYRAMDKIENNPNVLGYKVWLEHCPKINENEKEVKITLFCKNTGRRYVNEVVLGLEQIIKFKDTVQKITDQHFDKEHASVSIPRSKPIKNR